MLTLAGVITAIAAAPVALLVVPAPVSRPLETQEGGQSGQTGGNGQGVATLLLLLITSFHFDS